MFFFFFEEKSIKQELIEKLKSFSESLGSNEFEFEEDKNKVDIKYKSYGICTLKIEKLSEKNVSIKIMKNLNSKYEAIQKKSQSSS